MKIEATGKTPIEQFPQIGMVRCPALLYDGHNLLISYEISPSGGGGNAIVVFEDVLRFEQLPINVRGLADYQYPASIWSFTEVENSDWAHEWAVLSPRLWTISFNDLTLAVLFSSVRLADHSPDPIAPARALARWLGRL